MMGDLIWAQTHLGQKTTWILTFVAIGKREFFACIHGRSSALVLWLPRGHVFDWPLDLHKTVATQTNQACIYETLCFGQLWNRNILGFSEKLLTRRDRELTRLPWTPPMPCFQRVGWQSASGLPVPTRRSKCSYRKKNPGERMYS